MEKTRFLAAASHDLLQPLHAARLFTAALDRKVGSDAAPIVGQIGAAIRSADELLKTLLDISKLDAGGVEPVIEPVDVDELLSDLVETFAPLASERGLTLRRVTTTAVVLSDRVLLRSVVQNFLSNAVRYTQTGGIVVGVRRRAGTVMIAVYDSGPGFDEAHSARLFREFERGSRAEGGLGLGLAIVQRTAALLHHPVEVRSREGRGSMFAVLAPRNRRDIQRIVTPVEALPEEEGPLRPMRLLVVDDDPNILRAMEAWALGLGHAVTTAGDAAQGLARCEDHDAALIDFDLGEGIDGLELAVRLRARQPHLPIALITADRSRAVQRRARMLAIPILAKPAAPDELERWLARQESTYRV